MLVAGLPQVTPLAALLLASCLSLPAALAASLVASLAALLLAALAALSVSAELAAEESRSFVLSLLVVLMVMSVVHDRRVTAGRRVRAARYSIARRSSTHPAGLHKRGRLFGTVRGGKRDVAASSGSSARRYGRS